MNRIFEPRSRQLNGLGGEYIYKIRKQYSLSQADLSRLTGICQRHLSELERGNYKFMQSKTLDKLKGIEMELARVYDAVNCHQAKFREALNLKPVYHHRKTKMGQEFSK